MRVKRLLEHIEAVRWNSHGDHQQVVAAFASKGEHGCGRPFTDHGHLASLDCIVCPGDWIVTDHGTVTVWKDAAFQTAFEPVALLGGAR